MLVRALDRNAPLGLIVMAATVGLALFKDFYPLSFDDAPWYACHSWAQPVVAALGLVVSLVVVRNLATSFGLASGNVLTTVQAATYLVFIDARCSLFPLIGLGLFIALCGFLLTTYGVEAIGGTLFHLGLTVGAMSIFNHWAMLIMVWLLLSMLILRPFRMKELAIVALGFGMPYTVWLTAIMFTAPSLREAWEALGNLSPHIGRFSITKQHLAIAFFLLLAGVGALMASATGPVRQRNYILVLLLALIVLLAMVVLMGPNAQWPLAMLVLPASVILARMVQGAGNAWLSDALLIILLTLSLVGF